MRMQRISASCSCRNDDIVAAMQHNLPNEAVQNGLTGLNPNWMFAANVSDVLVSNNAVL
jgi:hypothetical protein